eukprot:CAMPEP_0185269246 /NCGR_PEP_ID=MMETSP1359-20130426/39241_1 /TAXON_ID=552665 /ORGANISM="Bigelowiella longifila, Strain CCMP242" /LENGTH=79 /DNA_ID=CAMNT_0027860329 /DNA_START=666 /DNA_END=901 /DNA_ORIENTATION=+
MPPPLRALLRFTALSPQAARFATNTGSERHEQAATRPEEGEEKAPKRTTSRRGGSLGEGTSLLRTVSGASHARQGAAVP